MLGVLVACNSGQQPTQNAGGESVAAPTTSQQIAAPTAHTTPSPTAHTTPSPTAHTTPSPTAEISEGQADTSPPPTVPVPTTVTVATQVTITATPTEVIAAPSTTSDLASSNPCSVLTGNDKNQCEQLIKSGKDVENIIEDPCASFGGALKSMCEQMMKADAGSRHGPVGDAEIPNPCAQLSGDDKARCEKEIADDPEFGGGGTTFVQNFDSNTLPKLAKFNFSELDKLDRMSKFRSVTGHDFSSYTSEYDPTGTNCRSMKHYMVPVGTSRENASYASTPHTFRWMTIKFFAPADGIIGNVVHSQTHGEPESQFTVGSTEHPGYYFGFFHVKLAPGLQDGSVVTAGQQIGTLGNEESFAEISVEARITSREKHLLSFLQVATDEVLEEYKARGVNAISDAIITKEERDANPVACDRNSEAGWFEGSYKYKASEAFMTWVFESSENWVFFD